MDDDALFDWIRHYAALVVLLTLGGVLATLVTVGVSSRRYEASTVVVQSSGPVAARQLASVASALFETAAVYEPTMEALSLEGSPREFLDDRAELRPVPDSNALIVVGSHRDQESAAAISAAMADSLVDALNASTDSEGFSVFSGPQPSSLISQPSSQVVVALGGVCGLWIGLALAVVHWRARKPLISLRRALDLTHPDDIVLLDGSGPAWLGALRRVGGRRTVQDGAGKLQELAGDVAPCALHIVVAGVGRRWALLERRLNMTIPQPRQATGGPTLGVIAAHPGSGLGELGLARLTLTGPRDEREDVRVGLVWIR